MFVEHIDLFRCPVGHEDSWLVAATRRTVGRRIVEGTLGCPVCRAEYGIADGVAYFGVEPGAGEHAGETAEAPEELAMRAAAFLSLSEAGGTVVLAGEWAPAGPALVELTRVGVVLVNPPAGLRIPDEGASVVRFAGHLPVGAGLLRGAAVDATLPPEATVHALRARARLVAPASAALPAECTEIARDQRHWVAELNTTTSAPVQLRLVRNP